MPGKNCWEAKGCGRQPGGAKSRDLGVCPAATDTRANGINDGRNGGRSCWVVSGTLCGGAVQGGFMEKMRACSKCEFFRSVRREQGASYVRTDQIMDRLVA